MKDIVDTAVSAGNFKTLVKALTEAKLVDTLKEKGPYTVFAPDDNAFRKLPKGALDDLLKDKEKLKDVLLYHVVDGKVMSSDVADLDEADTLEGSTLSIDTSSGVKVNGSKVTAADIECTNGVIHVIDKVLMP